MTLDESRNLRPLVPYLSGKAIGLHYLGAAVQKQHSRMFWSPSSLRLQGAAWLPGQQAFLSPSVWAGVIFFPTVAGLDQHGGLWDPEAPRLLVPSFDQGQNRKRCFPSILTAPSLASIPERQGGGYKQISGAEWPAFQPCYATYQLGDLRQPYDLAFSFIFSICKMGIGVALTLWE